MIKNGFITNNSLSKSAVLEGEQKAGYLNFSGVSLAQLVEAVLDALVALDGHVVVDDVGGHRVAEHLADFELVARLVRLDVRRAGNLLRVVAGREAECQPPTPAAAAADGQRFGLRLGDVRLGGRSAVERRIARAPAAALLVVRLPRRVFAPAVTAVGASGGAGARRRERLADGLIDSRRRQRRELDTPAVQKRRLTMFSPS